MKKNLHIGFVGLTHLGLNYLAASAEKKFKTLGIDLNSSKTNDLKKYNIEYDEPRLRNLIIKNKRNIKFSSDLSNLKRCQIVFLSQDIATDNQDKGDFSNLKKLIKKVSKFLNKKAIMVILSQVYPGFTRSINFDHSRLFYQVETLVLGKAVDRALMPERIIIGCEKSESNIQNLFLNYLKSFNCPIIKMKYESAELTKISINILLASSIITANILAEACNKISADWYEIMPALKLDERIGEKAYIKPGLGISGGNIERDISTIQKILIKNKYSTSIIKNFRKNSLYMKSWVYRILKEQRILINNNNFTIGILGLAYKANTNSVKNSPTLHLLRKIKNKKILIYDPKAKLKKKIQDCCQVNSINYLLKNSNVIILMTPWPEFKKIHSFFKLNKNQKIILIDPHRIINNEKIKRNRFKYFTIGK